MLLNTSKRSERKPFCEWSQSFEHLIMTIALLAVFSNDYGPSHLGCSVPTVDSRNIMDLQAEKLQLLHSCQQVCSEQTWEELQRNSLFRGWNVKDVVKTSQVGRMLSREFSFIEICQKKNLALVYIVSWWLTRTGSSVVREPWRGKKKATHCQSVSNTIQQLLSKTLLVLFLKSLIFWIVLILLCMPLQNLLLKLKSALDDYLLST